MSHVDDKPCRVRPPFSTQHKSSALLRLSLRVVLYSQLAPSAAFEMLEAPRAAPFSGHRRFTGAPKAAPWLQVARGYHSPGPRARAW